MKSVLLISHGSRSELTKKEVLSLAEKLKARQCADLIEIAFLEIEQPSIPDGIKRCVEKGANEVIVLLNFLNSGRHVNEDIPLIVSQAKRQYPGVRISISMPVGQHSGIVDLFQDLINQTK